MNLKLNLSVTVVVLAMFAATGFQPALATSLTYSDGIHVDGYTLPGINPASIPKFENAASIDWKAKLRTKHGVTTGTASLDASYTGGDFLFNGNATDSYTIDKGKYDLHADFIYDPELGAFVLDTTKGKNTVTIAGKLTIPSLDIDLKGTLFTAGLDSWAYSGSLIGFNTTITGGLICGTVFACTTHESAYLSLADGGFDPNLDLKHVSGTAVTTIPLPAAAWLLGSGLLGLAGISLKLKKT